MSMQSPETTARWLRRLDQLTVSSSRRLAQRSSRRHFMARLGTLLVGAGAWPLLPVARVSAAESMPGLQEIGDPESCDYWRYCALGGTLCTCCGGTLTTCPPGAEPSPISWVGTCHNPADGQDYLISYNDCCGKAVCQRCYCHRAERDLPVYAPSKANDILWCFGTQSHAYHCTVAVVMGVAGDA